MGKLQEFLMSNQDDIQATAEVAVSLPCSFHD